MTSTIDFDAFRREQTPQAPIKVKVGGVEYELAASLPASLALDIVRLAETQSKDAEVSPEDLMGIGSGLFGGRLAFRAVLENGRVTLEELPDFMKMIIEAYTDETADPKATAKQEPTPSR